MEGPPEKPRKQKPRRTTTGRPQRPAKKVPPVPEAPSELPAPTPPHPTPQSDSKPSAHPLTGIVAAAALLLFIGSQIVSQLQVQSSLGWQVLLLEKQTSALKNEITRLEKIEAEDRRLEKQAESVSGNYEALLKDLLTLAATDPEAQAIVLKFQIRTPL